ncbi:hypothetical protein [Bdellovibrio sp. HCB-110]|uniref:hypothetical protein n=1 Tax=Bdellovibrio sp. HCB-110 TaxID=3391182 RepID=UPI0039B63679
MKKLFLKLPIYVECARIPKNGALNRTLRKIILMGVLTVLTASCAHQKQLSRDEWLALTQRNYSGVTKETLIAKAEEVLRLADGDDFKFHHSENGFTASRNWLVYIVIGAASGTDVWNFQVEPTTDSWKVKVSVSTTSGNTSATAVGAITTPNQSSTEQGNAIYNIFWNRLDYLLGKSTQWMDCRLASRKLSSGEYFGNDEALCNSFNMTNNYPLDLSDAEIERIFQTYPVAKEDYLKKRRKSQAKEL